MIIYFCHGSNRYAPIVCESSGMLYGVRHDAKAYGNVKMLDVNWKHYTWSNYLDKIISYTPDLVILPDYTSVSERTELWARYEIVSKIVQNVAIVPKFADAIKDIPSSAIVALSVPAKNYGGTWDQLPKWQSLRDKRVHLLGGSPKKQRDFIRMIRAHRGQVVSLDNNYFWLKAAKYKSWMTQGGTWIREKEYNVLKWALKSANNLVTYLQNS